ncbi:MAG TPA: glycoside hydrolase family 3 N-terminal domain-containing protein [Anaerolineales bacterium]|nr:glycoside hydrolase family 3 N-terminal domain-containing protein [Anaerolineales bacterium]
MASYSFNTLDPATEARVAELLGQMTLTEKIGQLNQISPLVFTPPDPSQGVDARPTFSMRQDLDDEIRAGRIGSIFNTREASFVNRCQRLAVEGSRLGIPLLVGGDVIHGFRTIFPIPLALAATWDPDLVERTARAAAEEASATGVDWIFAPMVDIARDPRWGRIAEGAGEDVYLGCVMAAAQVRGFQSQGLASGRAVAACPKHFVAYGAAEAGRDYNTVDISERALREIYLPPFKAAFDAGAGSTMSAFNEIAGVPASANPLTLTTILREEWAWPGLVVSDYESVRELIPHGFAADLKDAGRLALSAGVDMDMMGMAYLNHLADLVAEGALPLAAIDEAVRRVLRLKFRLGLFEQPYVDESVAAQVTLTEGQRALALEAAQASLVLLKNQGSLLPLKPGAQRLAVIGPLAESRHDLLGCWSLFGEEGDVESVMDGLRAYLGDTAPAPIAGCPLRGDGDFESEAAVAAAEAADIVVLVVGEGQDLSGEAHCRTQLGLPGRQQALVDAVAATGKPLVVVLLTGRPLVIPELAEQATALLLAWHGGIRTGRAIADALFGAIAPAGRLTASWPRHQGQIPLYYAHKNTGRPARGAGTGQFVEFFRSAYLDAPNTPLFPFGYGLTYTQFAYRDLALDATTLGPADTLTAHVTISNIGERAGVEIMQLYVRDLVGSVTRPVRELKGFARVALEPGESRRVTLTVPVADLAYVGADLQRRVEPGGFELWLGPDALSGLETDFNVMA